MYDIFGYNEYHSLYYYEDVDVLKNKFNIKDEIKLGKMERILSSQRLSELAINPIKGKFDFVHLCKIHKYIFQDIYEWAGQLRNEDISDKLAFYMSQLNFAHPFREGNGRTQREFIRNLSRFNGYILEWDDVKPDELLNATIEATRRYRYEHLSKIIFRLLK